MKFIKEITVEGAFLPHSALELCGLGADKEVDLHTTPNALVVLKKRMTAMELVRTIDSLTTLAAELVDHLAGACGPCQPCAEKDGCPRAVNDYITVPEELLEEVGLPADAKLCGVAGPEKGSILVTQAGYKYDLRDLPPGLLEVLAQTGVCLGDLEELLMTEATIYGG